MSNLFYRLANCTLGKSNNVRPQSSATFFADAPTLEQNTLLESNVEQTVSQRCTENQKIVEPQLPVNEPRKLSTNLENLSAPASQYKNVRNDILSDQPVTEEITEVFDERNSPETAYSPLLKSTQQKNTLNDHGGYAGVLSSPVGKSQTDHVDERINISNRNTYNQNEKSIHTNNKNEFKPLLKQQADALDVVSKSAPTPSPSTNNAASETVEVHVSIGRIEVKAARQQQAIEPKKTKPKKNAPMSLEAYLAERESGKR